MQGTDTDRPRIRRTSWLHERHVAVDRFLMCIMLQETRFGVTLVSEVQVPLGIVSAVGTLGLSVARNPPTVLPAERMLR